MRSVFVDFGRVVLAVLGLNLVVRAEHSMTPFVAITGSPTSADVERKLDALHGCGVDSFLFYPTSGMRMEYLGEDFFRCARDFAAGAERRGMKMWLYDEYNWPSGSCRGRVPSENDSWRYAEVSYHRNPTGGVDHVISYGPRGWVSLLEPEAVDRFIELTYGAYARHLGKWIQNGTIVGMFTDEPGHPVKVKTPPNPICKYRWWSTLNDDYRAVTGRSFDDDAARAAVEPAVYARLLGKRFRETYYDRVRKVTDAWGIAFCGHLICDSSPVDALVNNGDPLLTLRGETLPGIDEIWSVVAPERIPFFLYALADRAISRNGRGGMAELFACGPGDMSAERMRRMIWLCALHGVTRYFSVMSAMDLSWMEQMRGFTTVVGEYQPWFAEFRTLQDEADRARAFAEKRCVRDVAVRYPQDQIARAVWNRVAVPEVDALLREIELDGFTPDLIRADETSELSAVFAFQDGVIVDEKSGRRFKSPAEAVAHLACIRPVDGRRRNVLLRRYEDGTRAELDLGAPLRTAVASSAQPVAAEWQVALDGPNRKRMNFDADGVSRFSLDADLTNVVFAVRRHVPNPALEDSPLIEWGSMTDVQSDVAKPYAVQLDGRTLVADRVCTCLRPGMDALYGMTEPLVLSVGEHRLKIVSGRADDNYYLPVAVLAGDFATKNARLVAGGPMGLGPLVQNGREGFAGAVTYEATVAVPEGAKELMLDTGNAFARVVWDGVDLGCRAWPPFAWPVPEKSAGGRHHVRIRLYTSFLPLLGDEADPRCKWKKAFYQPPRAPEVNPGLSFVGFACDRGAL